MAFDYTEFESLADSMIEDFGRSITVLKSGTTRTSSTQQWRGVSDGFANSTAGTEVTTYGVFLEYNERDLTEEVKRGDQMLLVAAEGKADLSAYDGVRDGTRTWRIVSSKLLKPGATRLLYQMQVRQ